MTSHFRGSISALLLAIVVGASAHASDILLNGDFSEGKAHWHGDGDPAVGALVVNLKPDKWTAVTQRFTANSSALKLTITYALSDDCTLGKNGDKLIPPLTSAALNEACGVGSEINMPLGKFELWKVLVAAGGFLISEDMVRKKRANPSDDPSSDKTYTADLTQFLGTTFEDCNLCLCFPPGQGSVSLKSVKLLPPGQ